MYVLEIVNFNYYNFHMLRALVMTLAMLRRFISCSIIIIIIKFQLLHKMNHFTVIFQNIII